MLTPYVSTRGPRAPPAPKLTTNQGQYMPRADPYPQYGRVYNNDYEPQHKGGKRRTVRSKQRKQRKQRTRRNKSHRN